MKDFKSFNDVYDWLKRFNGMKFKSYVRLGNFLMYDPKTNGTEMREALKNDKEKENKVYRILEIINRMYRLINGDLQNEKWFINKVKTDLYKLVYTVQGMVL